MLTGNRTFFFFSYLGSQLTGNRERKEYNYNSECRPHVFMLLLAVFKVAGMCVSM